MSIRVGCVSMKGNKVLDDQYFKNAHKKLCMCNGECYSEKIENK